MDSEAIVTIGSKEGLAHLMLACLERGDTVLVPNPSYPIHIYGAIIAGADIVLLGTGARQRFPHPKLTAPLGAARIALEVMDLKAACRTYNILVAEERKVALALLFE